MHLRQVCEVIGEDSSAGGGDGGCLQDGEGVLSCQAGLALVPEHLGSTIARLVVVKTASRFDSVSVDGPVGALARLRLCGLASVQLLSKVFVQVGELEGV